MLILLSGQHWEDSWILLTSLSQWAEIGFDFYKFSVWDYNNDPHITDDENGQVKDPVSNICTCTCILIGMDTIKYLIKIWWNKEI